MSYCFDNWTIDNINLRMNYSEESYLYSVLAKRVGYLDIILDLFNF